MPDDALDRVLRLVAEGGSPPRRPGRSSTPSTREALPPTTILARPGVRHDSRWRTRPGPPHRGQRGRPQGRQPAGAARPGACRPEPHPGPVRRDLGADPRGDRVRDDRSDRLRRRRRWRHRSHRRRVGLTKGDPPHDHPASVPSLHLRPAPRRRRGPDGRPAGQRPTRRDPGAGHGLVCPGAARRWATGSSRSARPWRSTRPASLGGRSPDQSTRAPPLMTAIGRQRTSTSSERVLRQRDEVGEPARRQRPRPAIPTPDAGRAIERRRADRLERTLAQPDLVAELDRVHARAGTPRCRSRTRCATPAATALRNPSRWAWVVSSFLAIVSAGQPARVLPRPDPVAVVDIGHEVRPVLHEQRDALVVDERAVLDRADSAADRELDALGAVGVGRDEHPERGRLVHGRLDHRQHRTRRRRAACRGSGPRR